MASLANKYRPTVMSEVKGNDNLKSIIVRTLKKKDRPQTYILQGERGCGKTTMARIMAREFGGKGRDIREINISDMRGIDTARLLIESVGYAPLLSDSKVIILNEVHKATNEFQNAMLEKLEEPPANVYFILCTTDPGRLLKPVLSRCALRNYSVQPLRRREMKQLVLEVLAGENIKWRTEHITKLIKVVDGIPREALVLLDGLIELEEKRLTRALDELVNVVSELPVELVRAINGSAPWKEVARILKSLEGTTPDDIRWVILKYMRKVLLDNPQPAKAHIIECFEDSFGDSGFAGLVLACYKAVHF